MSVNSKGRGGRRGRRAWAEHLPPGSWVLWQLFLPRLRALRQLQMALPRGPPGLHPTESLPRTLKPAVVLSALCSCCLPAQEEQREQSHQQRKEENLYSVGRVGYGRGEGIRVPREGCKLRGGHRFLRERWGVWC